MSKRVLVLMCSIFLVVPLLFMGCTGDDGSTGATGATGPIGPPGPSGQDLTATAKPESCQTCHPAVGDNHQASYDQLYQDNVILVTIDNAVVNPADNTVAVNFHVKKSGVDFSCKDLDNLNIYFTRYDNTTNRFEFSPFQDRLSIKGTNSGIVYAGAGLCTSTAVLGDNAALLDLPGFFVVYGYEEQVGSIAARVKQVKYPYAALLPNAAYTALPNKYLSGANVAGCEKCHTVPYLKHGNIYGRTKGDFATEFVTCKACHLDNGPGGHQFWQELVDNPEMAAREWNGKLTTADNAFIAANYGYKTRLMNDVHMSHAMEFEYPQSMATCNTCHAGKLNTILADANFTAETCKSCHPVTGSAQSEKPQPSLKDIWAAKGVSGFHDITMTCNSNVACHITGGSGKSFKQLHTGYDPVIYTDNGVKYSTAITLSIDNVSFDNNSLKFGFSATGSAGGLGVDNLVIAANYVMVGPYAYDTKDFLGNLSSGSQTVVKNASGKWTATADLTAWAADIASKKIKRVEVAVRPQLKNAAGTSLALNAVSKTVDLATKKFVTSADIALVNNCNNCHDQLATTFHSPDRGGSIVVCRMCHVPGRGGSHIEMASRSIDSYAHAIHSFQAFDFDTYAFDNAVDSMYYDLKVESTFPTFGLTNCVACHKAGMFNVPDQSRSLPGVFSPSDNSATSDRNIFNGAVPYYVSGPGSRACGGCHRAELIKEDAFAELRSFNSHTGTNGYMLPTTSANYAADFNTAVLTIMSYFEPGIVLPAP